jgi:serine/threonine protein kinase
MAPEVHLAVTGSDSHKASYSTRADVFSVGMVFYYVLEGVAPRLPGGTNPDAHFAALAKGARPRYRRTKLAHQKLIDLCLRYSPTERPFASELVALLKADAHTEERAVLAERDGRGVLAKLCGFPSEAARARHAALQERAAAAREKIRLRQGAAL